MPTRKDAEKAMKAFVKKALKKTDFKMAVAEAGGDEACAIEYGGTSYPDLDIKIDAKYDAARGVIWLSPSKGMIRGPLLKELNKLAQTASSGKVRFSTVDATPLSNNNDDNDNDDNDASAAVDALRARFSAWRAAPGPPLTDQELKLQTLVATALKHKRSADIDPATRAMTALEKLRAKVAPSPLQTMTLTGDEGFDDDDTYAAPPPPPVDPSRQSAHESNLKFAVSTLRDIQAKSSHTAQSKTFASMTKTVATLMAEVKKPSYDMDDVEAKITAVRARIAQLSDAVDKHAAKSSN